MHSPLAPAVERLQLIDEQMTRLHRMIAAAMKAHQDPVIRLAEVSDLGVNCPLNHRRGGRSGQHVRISSRVNLMGGNLF